jgi:nitrous oxidase accessory protein NosD
VSWTTAVVRSNRFHDNDVGVQVIGTVDADVDGNVFEGNGVGFWSERATEPIAVTGGMWCGNGQDVEVVLGRPPTVVEPLPCAAGSTPKTSAP